MAEGPDTPIAEAPAAVAKGAKGFLKARMFGMPRWVFLSMLVAGLAIGLYLRRRNAADQAADEMTPTATDLALPEDLSDTIAGNYDDPGLAGQGVYGQPPGTITPVQTPLIPEGYPETAGITGDVAIALADALAAVALRPEPAVQGTGVRPPRPKPPKRPPRGGKGGGGKKGGGSKKGPGKKGGGHGKGGNKRPQITGGGPPTVSTAAHRPIARPRPQPHRPAPRPAPPRRRH